MKAALNAGNSWPWLASCQYSHLLLTMSTDARDVHSFLVSVLLLSTAFPFTDEHISFGYLIGNYPMGWLLQRYHSGRVLAISESRSGLSGAPLELTSS